MNTKKIAVPLAEGFEEIEAVSIIDVLRRANIEVVTVSTSNNLEVTGSHNIKIIADQLFTEINFDEVDMIVLPGGLPGATNLNGHAGLRKVIVEFNKNNKALGAICAAPLVLGSTGVLKSKRATCYPGFENQMSGAEATGRNVEVSGNIVTGKGAGMALNFALKIVEMLKGREMAENLSAKMIAQ